MRAHRALVAVVIAFAMAVPFGAVQSIVRGADAAPQETVLRIGFMQKVDSLNPYLGLTDSAHLFYSLVYDDLQGVGEDLEPVPNLALSWYPVPETDPRMQASGEPYGSVWQYNLTENAKWTDGEPFTADDVVFNIELNAKNYASMWAYQPYSFFMKYAEKIDEKTVRIHFYNRDTGEPCPAAYAYLISIPMLPKHKLQNLDPFYIGFDWTGVFENEEVPIVSTGPFKAGPNIYDEWLAGDHITLYKNPNYHWKADKGKEIKFDKLVLQFFDDSTAMVYALQNKQIDVAAFPPQAYKTIKDGVASGSLKNITTFDGPKITQYWTEIGICMSDGGPNPSRLDRNIRWAMAMATNKQYIVDQYYLGLADPGTTAIPPVNTYWHYEPTESEKFKYNLSAANELLTRAGYIDIDGDGIRECTRESWAVKEGLVYENTKLTYEMLVRREYPEEKDIARYLNQEWAKIGIDVNYRVVDEVTLGTMVYSYEYDTMIWYWSADIDPNYQLFTLSKKAWGGWNDNKWSNASYEENYTKSVTTMDWEQRKVYVDNCQRIHYLDAPYIILAYAYQTYAWRNDTFTGWGDWAAHPGRSIDNFWTGNPLYFDLEPIAPPEEPGPPWGPKDKPPVADAGEDMVVKRGELVKFNGLGSSDDIGIMNWTWRFRYDGKWVELYGPRPEFRFWFEGMYVIKLIVTDASNQTDCDFVKVAVSGAISEGQEWPWEVPGLVGGVTSAMIVDFAWVLLLVLAIAVAVFVLGWSRRGHRRPPGSRELVGQQAEALRQR